MSQDFVRFVNNARSKLVTALGADDTEMRVEDAGLFFQWNDKTFADRFMQGDDAVFYTLADDRGNIEIVRSRYTGDYSVPRRGKPGSIDINRGQGGTIPLDWPVGTKVEVRVTAECLDALRDQIVETVRENKGEKGDRGPRGPKGDKGDKGDKGERSTAFAQFHIDDNGYLIATYAEDGVFSIDDDGYLVVDSGQRL